MHIWFGFACAKTREALEKEEKPSIILQVSSASEFRHWLGEMLIKCWELFIRVEQDVAPETAEGEELYAKLRNDSKFSDLLDFIRRQVKLAEQELGGKFATALKIKCGKDYHDMVDMIEKLGGFRVFDTHINFEKVDEEGIYREAVMDFSKTEKG